MKSKVYIAILLLVTVVVIVWCLCPTADTMCNNSCKAAFKVPGAEIFGFARQETMKGKLFCKCYAYRHGK